MARPTAKQVAKAMKKYDLLIDLSAEPNENGKGATVTLNDRKGNTEEVFAFRTAKNGNKFIDKVLAYLNP